ncbi:MAG: DUF1501 domain-containing protein [Planctomycetales bacterium]|nr:DUF1501 domain-containing protein [Planctomycetales bacterium]
MSDQRITETGVRLNRRNWLASTACGFGALAASVLATEDARAATHLAPQPHFAPRAKRIIFLFMQGGVSQVDSFDYKPLLAKQNDAMMDFADARVLANTGKRQSPHRVMKSPWSFQQYGETGRYVSELFPQTAQHVDRLTLVHSMHTEGVAHGPATLFLHCGATNFIRPSMGAWVSYGLGRENDNLPAFVTIAPSLGNGGPRNYGNAFLPATCQGTPLGRAGATPEQIAIRNLSGSMTVAEQRRQLDALHELNLQQSARRGGGDNYAAVTESYELAWRMQGTAPEILDLSRETAETRALYGIDEPETDGFGRKCLLARRLCEAGTRFIQVTYGDNSANPAWDQHSNLPQHARHAFAVDKPIAGLLTDLERRGLLEDTIVWWGGEFGRTPYAQNNGTGRDHNPGGFTIWLAGGGTKPGLAYGATDEFGFAAVHQKVHMHDLHASLLHLLGLDHQRLTFRHAGRDFRLTDVKGRVVDDLFV